MIAYMIKLKEIPFASDWLAKGDFIFWITNIIINI